MMRTFTAFELKLIAIIAMTLDHIAYVYAAELGSVGILMRVIGRSTFPIMAFLLTEGFWYTRNRYRYCIRLLLGAMISTVPYYLVFGTVNNVMFTLAAGLLLLMIQDMVQQARSELPKILWQIFFAFMAVGVGALMNGFDWGLPGVIAIYMVGQMKSRPPMQQGIVCTGTLLVVSLLRHVLNGGALTMTYAVFLSGLPLATLWISRYNGKRGRNMKYLFYAYYPLHLLVLYAVGL